MEQKTLNHFVFQIKANTIPNNNDVIRYGRVIIQEVTPPKKLLLNTQEYAEKINKAEIPLFPYPLNPEKMDRGDLHELCVKGINTIFDVDGNCDFTIHVYSNVSYKEQLAKIIAGHLEKLQLLRHEQLPLSTRNTAAKLIAYINNGLSTLRNQLDIEYGVCVGYFSECSQQEKADYHQAENILQHAYMEINKLHNKYDSRQNIYKKIISLAYQVTTKRYDFISDNLITKYYHNNS